MNKRSAKNRRRGRDGQSNAGEVTVSSRFLLNTALTSGTADHFTSLQLCTTGPLAGMTDVFTLYRFEKLTLRIHPPATNSFVTAFEPGPINSAGPGTSNEAEFYTASRYIQAPETEVITLKISRRQLLGDTAMKFWRLSTTQADAFDATQFTIVRLGTTAPSSAVVEILYTVRFTGLGPSTGVPRPIQPPLKDSALVGKEVVAGHKAAANGAAHLKGRLTHDIEDVPSCTCASSPHSCPYAARLKPV